MALICILSEPSLDATLLLILDHLRGHAHRTFPPSAHLLCVLFRCLIGSAFILKDCHIVIMPSSFYEVLHDQKSADVCLSTMDGTPNPTVNAYMAVLVEKCQEQSIGLLVPLSY